MKQDVEKYMHYYNLKRLHMVNGHMSSVNYENYKLRVSEISWPVHKISLSVKY